MKLKSTQFLFSLPHDVLSQITAFITGNDISRLWICGDKILQKRFSSPGCVLEFHIVWDRPVIATIPQIVSLFPHILSFSLMPHSSIASLDLYRFSLQWLPKTLRKLHIVAKFISTDSFPQMQWEVHLPYHTYGIERKFPLIQEIQLKVLNNEIGGTYRYIVMAMPGESLTSLLVSSLMISDGKARYSWLKTGGLVHRLTQFSSEGLQWTRNMELADPTEDFSFFAHHQILTTSAWPISLVSLKLRRLIFNPKVKPSSFPQTLTKLEIARFTWDNRSFVLLPSSLTDWRTKGSVTVTSSIWANYAPQKLRIIHAKMITINSNLTALLPPSITELKLSSPRKSPQTFDIGNARLVSLQIPSTNQIFGPSFWNDIPASITDLEVQVNLHPIISVPTNLRRLAISGKFAQCGLGTAFSSETASGLDSLSLCLLRPSDFGPIFDLKRLPTYLTSLKMNCEPKLEAQDFASLPRQLVLLSFKNPSIDQNAQHTHLLPRRSLSSLYMQFGAITASDLQNLPPSLRELSLRFRGLTGGLHLNQLHIEFRSALPANLLKLVLISAHGTVLLSSSPSFPSFKREWYKEFPNRILTVAKEQLIVPWPY